MAIAIIYKCVYIYNKTVGVNLFLSTRKRRINIKNKEMYLGLNERIYKNSKKCGIVYRRKEIFDSHEAEIMLYH